MCSDLPGFKTSIASKEPLVLFRLNTRSVYSCFFESVGTNRSEWHKYYSQSTLPGRRVIFPMSVFLRRTVVGTDV